MRYYRRNSTTLTLVIIVLILTIVKLILQIGRYG